MRYGRTLLAGLGWAGTSGLALCVLIFLSAFLAFDDDRHGVKPRKDGVVRLPSVPDAEVPRVSLARPPARIARDDGGGGGGSGGGGAPASTTTPGAPSPLPPQPSPPTLGDTTRDVVGAVGTQVGQISPPAGQAIEDTGDTLGDAIDTLTPRR